MEPLYVRITAELKRKVEDKLRDPDTGILRYGALSRLIRELLEKWVAKDGDRRG